MEAGHGAVVHRMASTANPCPAVALIMLRARSDVWPGHKAWNRRGINRDALLELLHVVELFKEAAAKNVSIDELLLTAYEPVCL